MTSAAQHLDAIERWLGRAVGDAVAAALAVPEPAGASDPWQAVLDAYGCRARTTDERRQLVAITGCRFGAPTDEVQDVVDAIVALARSELAAVVYPDDSAQARRYDRLQRWLSDAHDEIIPHYRNRVTPRRTMFGDAIASARARAGSAAHAAPAGNRQAFLQRCERCGGPRLDPNTLDCAFCGARLGAGGA